jgi:hypothetical protein
MGRHIEARGELSDDGGVAELGVRPQLLVECPAGAQGVLDGAANFGLCGSEKRDCREWDCKEWRAT